MADWPKVVASFGGVVEGTRKLVAVLREVGWRIEGLVYSFNVDDAPDEMLGVRFLIV